MTEDYLSRLPYCLRSYVTGKKWKQFREVQIKAFDVLFNGNDHLLISSGTSSGKTEAALFPVITEVYNKRPKRISVLYVSPLIALIDDQYGRVSQMLKDSGIKLYPWHGEISASVKRRVMDSANGILQITPESLENIVNKHYDKVRDMFSDLRYVVIDEVHAFMNSDRGLHLLCELGAIEHIAGCKPRRIGLSATLSDYSVAKEWLRAGTDRDVSVVDYESKPNYDLMVTFDHFPPKDDPGRKDALRSYFERLFQCTSPYNCIVFTNNRSSVENIVDNLKRACRNHGVESDILAHHSSVSRDYRKLAEERLKDSKRRCITVATSTLELGIDVGDLDRVIHINAPGNVSSMVQKFGRSGRRDGHPVMICFCDNRQQSKLPPSLKMDLVKTIAEANLYLNENWIEPVEYSTLPYSLLFQQTVSYVKSRITATHRELATDILPLYPFRNITDDEYAKLLGFMVENEILDYNSHTGTFCIGIQGESMAREYEFGINFAAAKEFDVYDGRQKVGSIQYIPHIGETLQLAGNSWVVSSVNHNDDRIMVRKYDKSSEMFWKSGKVDTDTRILRGMYRCLSSNEEYPFLDDRGIEALKESRSAFIELGMSSLLVEVDGVLHYTPWLGTVQFETMYRILSKMGIADSALPPYSIIVREGTTIEKIADAVRTFKENRSLYDLVTDDDLLTSEELGKYRKYIPAELLTRQFVEDRLDWDFEIACDSQDSHESTIGMIDTKRFEQYAGPGLKTPMAGADCRDR